MTFRFNMTVGMLAILLQQHGDACSFCITFSYVCLCLRSVLMLLVIIIIFVGTSAMYSQRFSSGKVDEGKTKGNWLTPEYIRQNEEGSFSQLEIRYVQIMLVIV